MLIVGTGVGAMADPLLSDGVGGAKVVAGAAVGTFVDGAAVVFVPFVVVLVPFVVAFGEGVIVVGTAVVVAFPGATVVPFVEDALVLFGGAGGSGVGGWATAVSTDVSISTRAVSNISDPNRTVEVGVILQ